MNKAIGRPGFNFQAESLFDGKILFKRCPQQKIFEYTEKKVAFLVIFW
jgi:hypothetical protein